MEVIYFCTSKYSHSEMSSEQTPKVLTKIEFVHFDVNDPYNEKALMKLLLAKDLFQQELPRMPKDYITRLVFNQYHESILMF